MALPTPDVTERPQAIEFHQTDSEMQRITIDIDVQNIHEIVRKRSGRFTSFVSRYFMKEEKLRKEVEKRVADEIQQALEKLLPARLQQEGIQAHLSIRQWKPEEAETFDQTP